MRRRRSERQTAARTRSRRSACVPSFIAVVFASARTSRSRQVRFGSGRTSCSRGSSSLCSSTVASGTRALSTVRSPVETVSTGNPSWRPTQSGTVALMLLLKRPVGTGFGSGNTSTRTTLLVPLSGLWQGFTRAKILRSPTGSLLIRSVGSMRRCAEGGRSRSFVDSTQIEAFERPHCPPEDRNARAGLG